MDETRQYLEFRNVRVSASGLAEMDGARPLVSVQRSEIVQVELEYGVGAERPLINIVLAAALFALSLSPLMMLVNAFRGAGQFEVKFISAFAFAIPGLWLLDLAIRKRWLLRAQVRRGSRKILFPRNASENEVRAFWSEARSRFGYS